MIRRLPGPRAPRRTPARGPELQLKMSAMTLRRRVDVVGDAICLQVVLADAETLESVEPQVVGVGGLKAGRVANRHLGGQIIGQEPLVAVGTSVDATGSAAPMPSETNEIVSAADCYREFRIP